MVHTVATALAGYVRIEERELETGGERRELVLAS